MAKIQSDEHAVWWEGPLAIDADGAPNAYAPKGSGLKGLDYLANAGKPGNWYGVVCGPDGEPVVQGPDDPCPGFLISPTALQDRSRKPSDPRRYVDSTAVPYVAIPRNAPRDYGIRPADVALAWYRATGRASGAIIGDVGPKNKWGEGSIKLADNLGIPDSPKNGGAGSGVVIVVFKGSRRGWPRTNEDVASQVQDLLDLYGGTDWFMSQVVGSNVADQGAI